YARRRWRARKTWSCQRCAKGVSPSVSTQKIPQAAHRPSRQRRAIAAHHERFCNEINGPFTPRSVPASSAYPTLCRQPDDGSARRVVELLVTRVLTLDRGMLDHCIELCTQQQHRRGDIKIQQ